MVVTAQDLVAQADQKLQKGGFWSFMTGGPDYHAAQDLYQQAANQFKLSKDWQEAAQSLSKCAFCASSAGSSHDQASFLLEAGNVLKKISPVQAVERYEQAIGIYSAAGAFQRSGKLLVSIAELCETEMLGHSGTKEYYKRAAEMFELDEHSKTSYSKCNLKVAEYAAKDGDLDGAIRIFEAESEQALQNNLLQYNAKDHLFRAGILHLAQGDIVSINLAIEKYASLDPRFAASRECDLLRGLAEAFENHDVGYFEAKCVGYDDCCHGRFNAWQTDILLKAKDILLAPQFGELDLS